MAKKQRYFDKSPEESHGKPKKQHSKLDKVQTFKIKPPRKKWGRREADRQEIHKRKIVKINNPNPKFKGQAPIPKELLEKHSRGSGVPVTAVKHTVHQKRIENKEKAIQFAVEDAARNETLLVEDGGFLQADPGETTTQFTQELIVNSVDITAATKHFELNLQFGPYRHKYTRNGRHLLLGGQKGHVAAFDWVTKKLHCELNVMESVHDVSWLHIETMFAVAQKDWVYIYDNQGIELHCVKRLNKVTRMEFLPYHFLLATASDEGYLSWLDISIGQLVTQYNTKLGRLTMLAQNPWNAVLCLGHAKGVVSMWSPNAREPLAKMLCHKAPLTALHVDPKGYYMATSASNRELKIWDVRKLAGPVQQYKLMTAANNLNFSQKNLLAVGLGNVVEVYKDCIARPAKSPYLRHRFVTGIGNMNFCPYEDVLGVTTSKGFTSLLVPGAGEANYDALEANPFQSKSQRREVEVKALLEKIQPDLITLDPTHIADVDVPTLKDNVEAKQKLLFVKPPKVDYRQRKKAKGKGGSVKIAQNKKIVQETIKKDFIKGTKDYIPKFTNQEDNKEKVKSKGILDRFLLNKSKTK